MKKNSITIYVPNNTTEDEIKEMRKMFNLSDRSKEYRLNIFVGGNEDAKVVLSGVILDSIKTKHC